MSKEPKKPAGKLQPLRTPGQKGPAPLVTAGANDPGGDSPTEQWLEQHPPSQEFDPAAPVEDAPAVVAASTGGDDDPAAAPPSTDGAVEPLAPPVSATTSTQATAPPTPPVATTEPQPVASAPPTPAAVAPTEPIKIAMDAKFILEDGAVPWTGEQLITGLKERAAALPRAAEATKFGELFGFKTYEDTEKAWKPIIERLRGKEQDLEFLNQFLFGDEAKAAYLRESSKYYDENATQPQPGTQPTPTAAVDPEIKRELESLKAWRAQAEQQEANQRVARERDVAIAKYPFLAHRPELMKDLALTTQALIAQDPSKGLLDALDLKASIYDALLIAERQVQTPAVPAPVVPALNGSPGALPAGSRPLPNPRPKTFESLDDAVNSWAQEHPGEFK